MDVGDIGQLPSVGPDQLLGLSRQWLPTSRMTGHWAATFVCNYRRSFRRKARPPRVRTSVAVTDSRELERFYLDVIGLSFEKRQGDLAQLRAGNALIDIVPANDAGPAGGTSSMGGANLDHLCLRIEPFDVAVITNHMGRHDVICGAEALRYGAEGEGPSIYLRDPEGNGVELKGPTTDQ